MQDMLNEIIDMDQIAYTPTAIQKDCGAVENALSWRGQPA
jgi:hypothetical protein